MFVEQPIVFLPFISFCLVLFGLLLLASQGLKLFGSYWFFFSSIHQVAVLFIVLLSLRDLCCLLALDCPFKVSETGLRVSKFNFNFSSFAGAVGWAVLAFLPGIADWLLFPYVFFWSVYCNWLRMAGNNLAHAEYFLLICSFHQLPELFLVQLSLRDLFSCWL